MLVDDDEIGKLEIDGDGVLLVTNVVNRALPLIRDGIGDRVAIEPAPGDIPWTVRRISPLPPVECEPIAAARAAVPAILDYAVTKDAAASRARSGRLANRWARRPALACASAGYEIAGFAISPSRI